MNTLPPEVEAALNEAEETLPPETHGLFMNAMQAVVGALGISKAMKKPVPAPPVDDEEEDEPEPSDEDEPEEGEEEEGNEYDAPVPAKDKGLTKGYMNPVKVHDSPNYLIHSHGNGAGYTILRKNDGGLVHLQGDDATQFGDALGKTHDKYTNDDACREYDEAMQPVISYHVPGDVKKGLSGTGSGEAYDVGAWLGELAKSLHGRLDTIANAVDYRLSELSAQVEALESPAELTEQVHAMRSELGTVTKSFAEFVASTGAEVEAQAELIKSMGTSLETVKKTPQGTPRAPIAAGAAAFVDQLSKSMTDGVPFFGGAVNKEDGERYGLKNWEFQSALMTASAMRLDGADNETVTKSMAANPEDRPKDHYVLAYAALGRDMPEDE